MRVVAIVQARMGSSRLPGKVLMPVAGKAVLWHIIHRLRQARTVDAIAIATSTDPGDDVIEQFALREGVGVVRGPEDNVLARYVLAAEQMTADIIVRVTGDAPLIDPAMIDTLVHKLIESKADYCTGEPQSPSIHEGFSPFTFGALKRLLHEAGDDPVAREHVTAYFKKHPGFVRVVHVPVDADYQLSGARLSVDAPADLRFLEEVYARLKVPAGDAAVRDVVRLLRTEPDLMKINAHVHQRKASEVTRRVLFRCDGDASLGLGHVYRCLALADELRDRHGLGVAFAIAQGTTGIDLIRQADYPYEEQHGDDNEDAWLEGVIQRLLPDVLILDIRTDLTRRSVDRWRSAGILIVTLDDPGDRRLSADLAFYPPVPQVQRLDWTGFTGQLYVGWEWVVLRQQFAHRGNRTNRQHPVVLVTMGGSDPAGLTLKAVKALDLLEEEFAAVLVLGPGFCHNEALDDVLRKVRRDFNLRHNVSDMWRLMREADLAVASFGMTAYELAAAGVPAVHLCLTDDHAEAASAFVQAGMAVSLGVFTNVTDHSLAQAVRRLLSDVPARLRMASTARQQVDGEGTKRIAGIVAARVTSTDG
ncbi:MAG: NTP transferase domain-containing protein [Dehalococcoidia bacterium]